jgi:chromosome segregation ATPase
MTKLCTFFLLAGLFREHKRLANKLTQSEIRSLSKYIRERMEHAQRDLKFQLESLSSDYDLKLDDLEDAVTALKRELKQKNELLDEYKRSDDNLATVHKKREERLEIKQTELLLDLEKYRETIKEQSEQLVSYQKESEEKDSTLQEQGEYISQAQKVYQFVESAKAVLVQRDQFEKEILRLKLEVDKRDRAVLKLQRDIQSFQNEKTKFLKDKQVHDSKIAQMKSELQRQVMEVAAKCEKLTAMQFKIEQERSKIRDLQQHLQPSRDSTGHHDNGNGNGSGGHDSHREHNHANGITSGNSTSVRHVEDKANGNVVAEITKKNGIVKFTGDTKPRTLQIEHSRYSETLAKTEIQIFELQVVSLEDKVSSHQNEANRLDREIEDMVKDEAICSELTHGLVVHGNTSIEQRLMELTDSLRQRRLASATMLAAHLEQAPNSVSKEANLIRTHLLAFKKQPEVIKSTELSVRATQLMARMDTCQKAKYLTEGKNGTTQIHSHTDTRRLSVSRSPRPDKPERCFTVVANKPPTPTLGRAKHRHIASARASRRDTLATELYHNFSPTQLDLTLGQNNTNSYLVPLSPRGRSNSQADVSRWRKSVSEPHMSTDF